MASILTVASRRIEGVDVARGIASMIMIQGHAYHAWAHDEAKQSVAYRFTRLLGSLPLPAFLVLAGAAIALRVNAASDRGEAVSAVRSAVVRRGLMVVGWGYLTNVAYAWMDGGLGSLNTVLRADVLHVIGLSIVVLAGFGIRARRDTKGIDPRRFEWVAWALIWVPALICPWVSGLEPSDLGAWRFPLALWVDVPGVTLMPFVPLASWMGLGTVVTRWMLRAPGRRDDIAALAGAPTRVLIVTVVLALLAASFAHAATGWTLAGLGGALSRQHPAVWFNIVDLGARGVLVLALGALLAPRTPVWLRALWVRLGRGSLVAYVFHIPLCYGRPGRALQGRLGMGEATLWVMVLIAASVGVVYLRDWWRMVRRRRASATRLA